MKLYLRLSLLGGILLSVYASAATTQPATINDVYQGGFKDDYPQELVRVRSYVLSVQSDIATLLGLQYGQGFLHPVTIRFDDGAPAVSENPYFYVQPKGTPEDFHQELVANVEAFAKHHDEVSAADTTLRGGFRYALTQAMLNDLAAGDAEKVLPLWVQEGLAVYASGNGEAFVQSLAERVHRSKVKDLVGDLNRPGPYVVPKDWALYYLAVKYIASTGSLQSFVRDMTDGKSAADAVRNNLSQEWPEFEDHVHAYAVKALSAYAMSEEDEKSSTGRPSPR